MGSGPDARPEVATGVAEHAAHITKADLDRLHADVRGLAGKIDEGNELLRRTEAAFQAHTHDVLREQIPAAPVATPAASATGASEGTGTGSAGAVTDPEPVAPTPPAAGKVQQARRGPFRHARRG